MGLTADSFYTTDEIPTGSRHSIFGAGQENETQVTASDFPYGSFFIAKYSATGSLLWVELPFPNAEIVPIGAYPTESGGIAIAGVFESGEVVLNQGEEDEQQYAVAGSAMGFSAVLDEQGSPLFFNPIRGSGIGVPESVHVFEDGAVALSGWYSGEAIFGNETENQIVLDSGSSSPAFVTKYDGTGALIFARDLPFEPSDRVKISGASDGTFILNSATGDLTEFEQLLPSDVTPPSTSVGLSHFVAKFDTDGMLRWIFATIPDDFLTEAATIRPDGTVLFVSINKMTVLDENGVIVSESRILASGEVLIFNNFPLPAVYLDNVQAASDGTFVVTGTMYGDCVFGEGEPNETPLTMNPAGTVQGYMVMAKFNEDGSLIWAERAGGRDSENINNSSYAYDSVSSTAIAEDGSLLIAGFFEDVAVFDAADENETTLNSFGMADIFVAKYRP